MVYISLKNISKTYGTGEGKTVAIKDINIEIEKGEMVAIMGASGSGKTTLLNIIGLMDKQTSGEYYLDGEQNTKYSNIKISKIRNEKIGFIFQNFALMNNYSVYENVMLPLSYRKINAKEKKRIVLEAIKKVGIEEKVEKTPSQLSGGQKQRVSIARVLAADTEIILADEPTGALDKNNGKIILEELKKMNDLGKTVILITHDPEIANCCKRVMVIEDGQFIKDYRN